MTALTLLGPATPMLFQGQEFASSVPFLYFADHKDELRASIADGRREFLSQFPSISDPDVLDHLPPPADVETFERCKLDLSERTRKPEWYALHRDLIRLRRTDPVLTRVGHHRPDGAVLGPNAFLLRYHGGDDGDRLLLINLGCDLYLRPVPEPLLAPPRGCRWEVQWSSESPAYGGNGTPPIWPHSHLRLPGECALLLRSYRGPIEDDDDDDEEPDGSQHKH
jgi:maltooligosyltrehalose trehalohydrolase